MRRGSGWQDSNEASPHPSSGWARRALWCLGLLSLLTCVCLTGLVQFGSDLDLLPDEYRPGIGDVQEAEGKIKIGMTQGEVLSALGRPHRQNDQGREWRYWSDRLTASGILLVRFGQDERVISSEWWLD